jgi:membrane protease subunit (stomatin/prohibitin family)
MAGRTAVVAGTATAVSGRVARRQQGRWADQEQQQFEQQQQQAAPAAPPAAAPQQDDPMAKLKELGQLHENGVLTDDEFAAAKAKLLGI